MTGLFVTIGLLLQAVALVLLFRRFKGRWFVHIGAVFIVLATAYHGLNEFLLWLSPYRNPYRPLVSTGYVGQFVLWISVAILLFTLTHLFVLQPAARVESLDADWPLARIRRVFDWRLLLVATVPLMILTLAGNGSLTGAPLGPQLAWQFFSILTPLASFGIIARFGQRLFLPILLVQSTAIAAVGQRLAVLTGAALLLYALTRAGISIRRGQLAVTAVTFVLIALIITSARAAEGRFASTAGGSLRLDFLIAGIGNLASPTTREELAADMGYRLDGNSFGAMELEALDRWHMPVLGPRPLLNDLLLAVPSLLNPDKTLSYVEDRSEKAYAETYLDLPLFTSADSRLDILPTQLGALVGLVGPWGLLLAALLLGAAFGIADRWLRRLTPPRLLIGLGLLSCVLSYERSWDTYSVTLRGILVLLPFLWLLQNVRTGRKAPRRFRSQTNSLRAAGSLPRP